jgi:putative transposase
MNYKKWSLEQKLEILTCCVEIGIVETCPKYSVNKGTFYSWNKKMSVMGKRA